MATDSDPPSTTEPYYFGCHKEAGHFAWDRSLFLKARGPAADWLSSRDGRFPPLGGGRQGIASLTHYPRSQVTVLAFWDRSVDSRPGSNSTFLLPGVMTFVESVIAAREAFPAVWKRYPFEVTMQAEREEPGS